MFDGTTNDGDRFVAAVRELRRSVEHGDAGIERIMKAVRREQRIRRRLFPALVAAICGIVVSVVVWRIAVTLPNPNRLAESPRANSFVQFVYVGAAAQEVSLVGSFNNWDPQANPLRRDNTEGVWVAEVRLPPGHHEYAFNVDGHWVPDADAPLGASDEFGIANSVILVQ